MEIPKEKILEFLREQGDHDKADKAEKELPDKVHHEEHADLLSKIGIDNPTELLGKVGLKLPKF
jgi:hypothetical protein